MKKQPYLIKHRPMMGGVILGVCDVCGELLDIRFRQDGAWTCDPCEEERETVTEQERG